MKYDVSIVILAWNNRSDVEQCVNSIFAGTQCLYQLIVVDNGSTDDTPKYLEELQKNWKGENTLTVILNESNLGYAAGNNVALDSLEGKYTLFLNQDIVVQDNAIDQLVSWMEAHQVYGAIAPQLRYPDGRIQPSCRKLPTPGKMVKNYLKFSWDDSQQFDHTQSQDCEQPMASAIMLPTELIKEIGGFDVHPDYWLFFNDVDLSKQVFERGYKTYFLAEAVMEHHHGASTKKLVNTKRLTYWHKGMIRYFDKWYVSGPLGRLLLYMGAVISFCALWVREVLRGVLKLRR